MAASMNEADDEQNYDFQAICKLQAHIRGLLVRKKLDRLRDLYQRLALELDGTSVPGLDSNQILWRRPHLCKPVFVTQPRKTKNYAKSCTKQRRAHQRNQQVQSGRPTGTLTDSTVASTLTDIGAGILKDTVAGHSSEDSHSGKASQGEISPVDQNQALTEGTVEIDEGETRHSETDTYDSNDILAGLSVPSRNDTQKLCDSDMKGSDSQSDATDTDSRCDMEKIADNQVIPEVDGHSNSTGDVELGRILDPQSGGNQIDRVGIVESPKELDIVEDDRGPNRTGVTGGTRSSDDHQVKLEITKVVDARSHSIRSDDGIEQTNTNVRDHMSATGSSGRNSDCGQGHEQAEVAACDSAPRTRDNQVDILEDQVSSEQPGGLMQQRYNTDSSSTNRTKSRDNHYDKGFLENQTSNDKNQRQQDILVSSTARVPGGLMQQDGKDRRKESQRDCNKLADVEPYLDEREGKKNNETTQDQESCENHDIGFQRRIGSEAIGDRQSRHDNGMYPADDLRLSLDSRKTSSRMEDTGITDVTSIWSSEHSFQESITPISDYPSDVEELQKVRSSMAMELLWVQQAISSRKNYLRLKKNMNDG